MEAMLFILCQSRRIKRPSERPKATQFLSGKDFPLKAGHREAWGLSSLEELEIGKQVVEKFLKGFSCVNVWEKD